MRRMVFWLQAPVTPGAGLRCQAPESSHSSETSESNAPPVLENRRDCNSESQALEPFIDGRSIVNADPAPNLAD